MKALVTGGGGFLGGAIAHQLRARGDEVRSFSRSSYPELEAAGIQGFCGDVADLDAVRRAADGCDVVFHAAAKAGVWGSYAEYHRINVTGTENVLCVCRELGIHRLVYTSSPSVVFAGDDQEGVDETTPYPRRFLAAYPHTKALAERLVLGGNSPDLLTVALRPHLIWGPRDNHLVPRVISRARTGKLWLVGKGGNRVDSVYIDNAAHAHLLAADRLRPGSTVAGKAYFVSQGEPIPLADLVNRILAASGLPPVRRRLPAPLAYGAGALLELIYTLLRKTDEPRMTRFLARQLATSHWFELAAARRDLDYRPEVTLEEGMKRLATWLETRRASRA